MALFAPKVERNPQKRYPDTYYKHVYVNKPMFAGIDLVAKFDSESIREKA
jgi:hypothetical protein